MPYRTSDGLGPLAIHSEKVMSRKGIEQPAQTDKQCNQEFVTPTYQHMSELALKAGADFRITVASFQ